MSSIQTCVSLPVDMVERLDLLHCAERLTDPDVKRAGIIRRVLRVGLDAIENRPHRVSPGTQQEPSP